MFVQIRDHNHIRNKTLSVKVEGKLENVNAIVNFAQIVKKATCLMTTRQYNLQSHTWV